MLPGVLVTWSASTGTAPAASPGCTGHTGSSQVYSIDWYGPSSIIWMYIQVMYTSDVQSIRVTHMILPVYSIDWYGPSSITWMYRSHRILPGVQHRLVRPQQHHLDVQVIWVTQDPPRCTVSTGTDPATSPRCTGHTGHTGSSQVYSIDWYGPSSITWMYRSYGSHRILPGVQHRLVRTQQHHLDVQVTQITQITKVTVIYSHN